MFLKTADNEKKVLFAIEAQLLSNFGSSITGFALGIWIFKQEGSVTSLSLLYFFQALPSIIFSYFSGVVVDSFSRKKVLVVCDILFFILLAGLLVCYLLNNLSKNFLYGYVTLCTIVSITQTIALGSLAGSVVDPTKRVLYNTIINLRKTLPRLIAPLLAGFLILYVDLVSLMVFNLITFLISLATISFLPTIISGPRKQDTPMGMFRYFGYAIKLMASKPAMLYSVICMQFSLIYTSLLGVYVIPLALSKHTSFIAGILTACGGVGALLGSKYLTKKYQSTPEIFLPISVIIQSIFMFICSIFMTPILLAIVLFIHFFFVPTQSGCANTIWQNQVSQEEFGKILSIQGLILQITCCLALLLAGPLAENMVSPLIRSIDLSSIPLYFNMLIQNSNETSMYMVLSVVGLVGLIVGTILMRRTRLISRGNKDIFKDQAYV